MTAKRLGSNFILDQDNWRVIAKFSYEHFLQFGSGAVVISDEDTRLESLAYIRASDILSLIDGGQLVNADGRQWAHVESLVYDFAFNQYPRVSIATEIERERFEHFLSHDADYGVLYIIISGQTARIGQCGNMRYCPARIYNSERIPEIDYFSQDILFNENPDSNTNAREHYSQHLQAMAEPVLAHLPEDGKEVYRFLWLRSFHSPVAVRVEKDGSDCSIVTKMLEGAGGYYPKRTISQQTSNKLAPKHWLRVISLIEKSDFWQSPSYRSYLGMDGADWVLEGYRSQRYYAIARWSPDAEGLDKDFREVCLYLLELSDVKVPVSEVY